MDFIYKLYGNEYFGVVLFTIIGILAFLFILILILGKMDEKKSKKEETSEDALKDVTPQAVALEVPEEIPTTEPIIEVTPMMHVEPTVEEVTEEPLEETEEEEVVEPIAMPESDPFATAYLDLSEIERSLESPVEEEPQTIFPTEIPETKEVVTSATMEEPTRVTPLQDQFSSVYVNHTVDVPAKPAIETPVETDLGFELPKRAGEVKEEIPATEPAVVEETETVVEENVTEVPGLTMFPDIETETYHIEK